MKTHDIELGKIRDLLRENPKGLKISRIAGMMGMNRNAAAKYLEILLMTGQVEQLEHGMSKIFILSRRTGIPTMLDRSEDFILVLDKDMQVTQVNGNFLAFSGLSRESVLGRRPDAAGLPIIGRSPVTEKIREAHYGTDIRTEVRDVVQGEEFFFDVRITPTAFNDGTRGVTIIIGDVTRDKRRLARVEDESRRLVEGVLSCIDDPVVLIDPRTSAILFANPAAMRMFCGPTREAGTAPGLPLTLAGIIPGAFGTMQDAFRCQGFYEVKSRMRRNDSELFPVSLHLRPIYDSTGTTRNIVVVIRDLTIYPGDWQGTPHDTWALQPCSSPRNSPESRGSGSVL